MIGGLLALALTLVLARDAVSIAAGVACASRRSGRATMRSAERTAYAEQLVTLAQRLSNASAQPALAMAKRRDLSTRVTSILDAARPRGKPLPRTPRPPVNSHDLSVNAASAGSITRRTKQRNRVTWNRSPSCSTRARTSTRQSTAATAAR